MRTSMRVAWPAVAMAALSAVGCGRESATVEMSRGRSAEAAAPPGAAIVADAGLIAEEALPDADAFLADPSAAAQALRDAGLFVASDPGGRSMAVTSWADMAGMGGRVDTLGEQALAALLLSGLTETQYEERDKGYLSAGDLDSSQASILATALRRQGMIDAQGSPTHYPGASPTLGVWRTRQVYARVDRPEGSLFIEFYNSLEPPSLAAIPAAPLGGSVHWWTRVHMGAEWSDVRVDVPGGVYILAELVELLNESVDVVVRVSEGDGERPVLVAARDASLAGIVWAIETALGVRIEVVDPVRALEPMDPPPADEPGPGGLWPLPEAGYFTPLSTELARREIAKMIGGPGGSGWAGWRVSEMPLMYREMVSDAYDEQAARLGVEGEPLDLEHTYLIWLKGMVISQQLRLPDGGWAGREVILPAL